MLKQQQQTSAKCWFVYQFTLATLQELNVQSPVLLNSVMRKTRKPESRMFYTVSFFITELFKSSSELSGLTPEQRTLPGETSQRKHLHLKTTTLRLSMAIFMN